MSWEAWWYQCYSTAGRAPHCARLCRRPLPEQWEAAIDVAIEFAAGLAGYRRVTITLTGEQYWWWHGQWWLLPRRVATRALVLVDAATLCECRHGRGVAESGAIVDRLRIWKRTGHWRRLAAKFYPRHASAAPRSRRRKRNRM